MVHLSKIEFLNFCFLAKKTVQMTLNSLEVTKCCKNYFIIFFFSSSIFSNFYVFYFYNDLWTNLLWYYGSRNHHSTDRKPHMCIHYPNLQCSISWYYKWQFEILDGKIMPKQGTYNYAPATVDSLNAEEASNLKVNDVSRWDC
jgi:hypothetical protein